MSNKMNKEKSDLYMGRDMNNIRIRMKECGKPEILFQREVSVCYKCTIDLSCDGHLFIKHKNEYSVDSTMRLHHRGVVFNGDGTCEFYVMGRAKCSRQDKFDEAKGIRLARLDANIHAYKRGCSIIREHQAMLEQYIRHFDDTNELFKSRLAGFQKLRIKLAGSENADCDHILNSVPVHTGVEKDISDEALAAVPEDDDFADVPFDSFVIHVAKSYDKTHDNMNCDEGDWRGEFTKIERISVEEGLKQISAKKYDGIHVDEDGNVWFDNHVSHTAPVFVVMPFDNDSVWNTIHAGMWEEADKLKVLAVYKTLTNFGAFEYQNNVLDDPI